MLRALKDLRECDGKKLLKRRYENYQGNAGKWDLGTLLDKHVVPKELRPAPSMRELARDCASPEARRVLDEWIRKLEIAIDAPAERAQGDCTYDTWEWDTVGRKSVGHRQVRKPRFELTAEERGTIPGCSVCREDQAEIRLNGLPPIQACRALADRVRTALERALAEGFPIRSLVGYRVGRTKGPIDARGLRTRFSNHSYGTAIDVNAESNGLYDDCVSLGPSCKLIRGGAYVPTAPEAITPTKPLYRALISAGLKWGGEIQARQKDFMHFSPDGM